MSHDSPTPMDNSPAMHYIRHLAGYPNPNNTNPGTVSMGVPLDQLPLWDDILLLPAQVGNRKPLLGIYHPPIAPNPPIPQSARLFFEEQTKAYQRVGKELILGQGEHALKLETPLLISDMSFGSLSDIAKYILATGAEEAGTAICSGEGGILDIEANANSRFILQVGTAEFGLTLNNLNKYKDRIKAVHFKGGQAAKTGTGGLLPAEKITDTIREARGLGDHIGDVHSPATFLGRTSTTDMVHFKEQIMQALGKTVPFGYKLSANHIEADIDFALAIGCDYIILDGRGGATGAAPAYFRNHISIPTIPALARARRHLDAQDPRKHGHVKLIITGGLRVPADFVKALALGADAVALSNSVLWAMGCIARRKCYDNQCPVGIATQDPNRIAKLLEKGTRGNKVDKQYIKQVKNFLEASVKEMQTLAAACGLTHLNQLSRYDIATFNRELAYLAGVPYAGVGELTLASQMPPPAP